MAIGRPRPNWPSAKRPTWHRLTAVNVREDGERDCIRATRRATQSPYPPARHESHSAKPLRRPGRNWRKSCAKRIPSLPGRYANSMCLIQAYAGGSAIMLAGIPFDFNRRVQPALPGHGCYRDFWPARVGGSAAATQGEDGLFRARIRSPRDARWEAGPISLEYSSAGGIEFPKWGNLIQTGEFELVEDSLNGAPDGRIRIKSPPRRPKSQPIDPGTCPLVRVTD